MLGAQHSGCPRLGEEGGIEKSLRYLVHVLVCLLQNKSTSTPTSPGPRTHSTPSIPVLTAGQSGLYSPQYISYIPQIHMGPAVQVREESGGPRVRGMTELTGGPRPTCRGRLRACCSASPVFWSPGTADVSLSCVQLSAWTAGQVPGRQR